MNNKRNWKNIIPNMTCDENLVKAFRKEAQLKQWTYTTLMNNILKERYMNKPLLLFNDVKFNIYNHESNNNKNEMEIF